MKNLLKKRRQTKINSKADKRKATKVVFRTGANYWTAYEHKACMKAI